jgi:hypothetical protein
MIQNGRIFAPGKRIQRSLEREGCLLAPRRTSAARATPLGRSLLSGCGLQSIDCGNVVNFALEDVRYGDLVAWKDRGNPRKLPAR